MGRLREIVMQLQGSLPRPAQALKAPRLAFNNEAAGEAKHRSQLSSGHADLLQLRPGLPPRRRLCLGAEGLGVRQS